MKVKSVEMVTSAVLREQYPAEGLPEVAVVGRSNVGKSSLINNLLDRKSMARVSSQPGKTRTINFFRVNGDFFLVDLPGYGYARVSKSEQLKWGRMMDQYLNTRTTLRGVIQLVDIRHEPTQLDRIMYDWVKGTGFPGIVVATKSDEVPRGRRNLHYRQIIDALEMEDCDVLLPFSSRKNEGRDELWEVIDRLIGNPRRSG